MGLFSIIYGIGLACKRYYCVHHRTPAKLPAKVISIGNLTLGGTGKTPAVIAVAREAKKRGHNPCILTRGYKGRAKDIAFVSRGEGPLLGPCEAGDEACLMAESLKRVTIIKGRDRFKAGIAAFDNISSEFRKGVLPYAPTAPTLFILDDGFQHWKLHRDVDVLLIDATSPFGNDKLFPEGRLREPLRAMKRAHIIIITKADMAARGALTSVTRKIKKYNQDAPVYTAAHVPTGLINTAGESIGLEAVRGKRIFAFSGIANPAYFQSTLAANGVEIAGFRKFRDHYIYSQKDINEIIKESSGLDIITTEKDLVKLKGLDVPDNLRALRIEFSVDNDFYDFLFRRLK